MASGLTPVSKATFTRKSVRCCPRRRRVDFDPPYGEASFATPVSGARKRATESRAFIAIEKARTASAPCASTGEERSSSRSPSVRDGHRFESPQLHQVVGANRPGFPVPTIPRLFSALAEANGLQRLFCRDDGPWPASTEMSLRRRILGSQLVRPDQVEVE
jgi:hypothetical protein